MSAPQFVKPAAEFQAPQDRLQLLRLRLQLLRHVDDVTADCWRWTGARCRDGYGQVKVVRRTVAAHRASYAAWHGTIPAGQTVHHHCRCEQCIKPDHLSLLTRGENAADANRHRAAVAAQPPDPCDNEVPF